AERTNPAALAGTAGLTRAADGLVGDQRAVGQRHGEDPDRPAERVVVVHDAAAQRHAARGTGGAGAADGLVADERGVGDGPGAVLRMDRPARRFPAAEPRAAGAAQALVSREGTVAHGERPRVDVEA